jgi:hypothetical protein
MASLAIPLGQMRARLRLNSLSKMIAKAITEITRRGHMGQPASATIDCKMGAPEKWTKRRPCWMPRYGKVADSSVASLMRIDSIHSFCG